MSNNTTIKLNEPFKGYSLADTAQKLCEDWGFSVFPLKHKSKKPAIEWDPCQETASTAEFVSDWWEHHPGCNIGIACGKVSNLVVVDADSEEAVKWVEKNYIKTPVKVRTHRGYHYYYKYPEGQEAWLKAEQKWHKDLKDHVDVQIYGFYVVGPNSIHPDDGSTYTMLEELPGAWTDDYVPELQYAVDPQSAQGGIDLERAYTELPKIKKGGRHDAILRQVGAWVAKGLPYSEVMRLARDMAANRCEQTIRDPLDDQEICDIVRWVFKAHAKNHPAVTASQNAVSDSDMTGLKLAEIKDDLLDEWPEELLHPGGLLEEIADYTEISSTRTERIFAIGGALSLVGSVCSQRVMNKSRLTTNEFILLVGRSSSGKDAPRKAIIRILKAASKGLDPEKSDGLDLENLYGGSDVSSDTSILTYLKREKCHRALFLLDEVGQFFKMAKNPNSPRCNIIKTLTELYHKGLDGHIKRYANPENDLVIPWLSLSLIGMSVPSELWPSLSGGETVNGFLSRCLVLESRSVYKHSRNVDDVSIEIGESLIKGVQKLWTIETGEKEGSDKPESSNENGTDLRPCIPPTPHDIDFDDEAKEFRDKKTWEVEEKQAKALERGDEASASIYGRCNAHAIKLALIKYMSDNASKTHEEIISGKISLEQIKWAWLFIDEATRRTLASITDSIFTSDFESYIQAVYRSINKHALKNREKFGNDEKPGATWRDLSRDIKGLNSKALKDVLEKCIQSDTVRTMVVQGKKGRPSEIYVRTEDATE